MDNLFPKLPWIHNMTFRIFRAICSCSAARAGAGADGHTSGSSCPIEVTQTEICAAGLTCFSKPKEL